MSKGPIQPPVKVWQAHPMPLGTPGVVHWFGCKNSNGPSQCDRYACTAATKDTTDYCCPGCAAGTGHTDACNESFVRMKEQVIEGAMVLDSDKMHDMDLYMFNKVIY